MKREKSTKKTVVSGMALSLSLLVFSSTAVLAAPVRYDGSSRYETAEKIVNAGWPSAKIAILASGLDGNRVDALTIAPLSKKLEAPIVLVEPSNKEQIVSKLTALGVKTVYIANGEGVIKPEIKKALEEKGMTVEYLGGVTRIETALNIAQKLGVTNANVVIVNGEEGHLVDALSIASIAAAKEMPILLTDGVTLEGKVKTYIDGLGATNSYLIGGTSIVSDTIKSKLPGTKTRLAGNNRYQTNYAVINTFKKDAAVKFDKVFIASGKDGNLVDTLSGAALAGKFGATIVLVEDNLSEEMKSLLNENVTKDTVYTVFGGNGAVSTSIEAQIKALETAKNTKPEETTPATSTSSGSGSTSSHHNNNNGTSVAVDVIDSANSFVQQFLDMNVVSITVKQPVLSVTVKGVVATLTDSGKWLIPNLSGVSVGDKIAVTANTTDGKSQTIEIVVLQDPTGKSKVPDGILIDSANSFVKEFLGMNVASVTVKKEVKSVTINGVAATLKDSGKWEIMNLQQVKVGDQVKIVVITSEGITETREFEVTKF